VPVVGRQAAINPQFTNNVSALSDALLRIRRGQIICVTGTRAHGRVPRRLFFTAVASGVTTGVAIPTNSVKLCWLVSHMLPDPSTAMDLGELSEPPV
jgi:hypothetical protein